MKIKRALISVSDKTNLLPFAQQLHELGIQILSTGGTAKLFSENNIPVTLVSDVTNFPEIMNGRVKTLHPKIHAGILARRDQDLDTLKQHNIDPIDLVVVNLYPFAEVTARPDCDFATAIENIDIGGPCMVRAAAKNNAWVTVITDPNDYTQIIEELKNQNQEISETTRIAFAKKAFAHTAQYDAMIAKYFISQTTTTESSEFPAAMTIELQQQQSLRYGENPHQQAALYTASSQPQIPGTITGAKQLQGKPLSYNNIADADTALECVKSFSDQPACVIVKHANPCGVAKSDELLTAYKNAYATDPTSAFGGIIAFNQALDVPTAETILKNQFVEVVIAPEISKEVCEVFKKKPNVRLLACGRWENTFSKTQQLLCVGGGILMQDRDIAVISENDLKCVTKRKPSSDEIYDLLFAWTVVKFVKSNAIVYTKNQTTIGIGAGQMSRVYSAKIAEIKAADENLPVAGSVMASDAFFPFRDTIDTAAKAGITAIIQPGGSIRDEEVIAAADEANLAMVFTGIRHFRH